MATQPVWFDEEFYLNSKLQQLQQDGIEGFETVDDVRAAIEASSRFDSVYDHFAKKSLEERTDPNEYFDTTQYLEAKARQLNEIEFNGSTEWTAQSTEEALAAAGYTNAYDHFHRHGWKEDVNPSNDFDVSDYLESKAGQLSETEFDGRTDWTAEQVEEAFINANTDPVTHFIKHGQGEEIPVTPVPEDEQVPAEVELTLEQAVADAGSEEGLPELYSIDPQQPFTIDDPVDAAAALSTYTTVQEVLDGASNSSALTLADLFNWSVSDEAANLFDGEEVNADLVDVLAGADAITVTTTVDETQQAALEAINDNVVFEGGFLGEDLELTSGVDYILAPGEPLPEGVTEDMVQRSTESNDSISGVVSSLTTARTLDQGDQIDAGEGIDTLTVDLQANFNGFTGDGSLRNVETVELTNDGSSARTFNATGAEGVETYSLTGAINLSNLAAVADVDIAERESGTVTIGYAESAVDADDIQNLGLDGAGSDEDNVTVEVDDVQNLAINATGENYVELAADSASSLVASGTGSLNVAEVEHTLTNVDASGLEGDLDLALDVATDIGSTATIVGSAGESALMLSNTGVNAAASQFAMSGVETVELGALNNRLTFSASNVSDLETIVATEAFNNDALLANFGTAPLTFELQGANTGGTAEITSTHTGASTVNVVAEGEGDNNQVDLTLDSSTQVDINVGSEVGYNGEVSAAAATASVMTFNTEEDSDFALDAENIETLNVTTSDAGDVTVNATNSDLSALQQVSAVLAQDSVFTVAPDLDAVTSVELSGQGKADLGDLGSDTAEDITVNAANLQGGLMIDSIEAESITVDAGADAGGPSIVTALASEDATVTGAGLAENSIAVGGAGASTLSGGLLDDRFLFTNSAAKFDSNVFEIDSIDTITDFSDGDSIAFQTDALGTNDAFGTDGAYNGQTAMGTDDFAADASGTGAYGFDSAAMGEQDVVFVEKGVATFYIDDNTAGGTGTDAVNFETLTPDSLEDALTILDNNVTDAVVFKYDNDTYLFEAGGSTGDMFATAGSDDDDFVVELQGITTQDAAEAFGFDFV